MPQSDRYQCLVLGSGNGGMILAWHLARSGKRTAVVERRYIGGSCHNVNCLPSKNEIWSAKVADLIHHAGNFGAKTGTVTIDMAAVRQRKRAMVEDLKRLTLDEYRGSGAELIMGTARFTAPKTLQVELNDGGTRVLTGEQVFVNLGTRASMPSVPGIQAARPLTNVEALELDHLPEHLIVLGGGYVGLEMAQAFRRFGSRVSIIEQGPQIAGREDADVAAELQRILQAQGIAILVGTVVDRVERSSSGIVTAVVRNSAGERRVEGSDILVAVGRTPNTQGVGLEAAGIELDARGFVRVNERLETSAPGVWAIGDCCAGNPQFTHVSFDDFRIIRDNLAGGNRTRQDRLIPYCVFTDPQIAHIGLSERDAQQQSIRYRLARLPMSAVLRTLTTGEKDGFMKALVSTTDDRILGFTMIGAEAGEVLAAVQTAMLAGAPYTVLRDAVIAHPTHSEGLGALFSGVPARA
jgi:pyruvate/2-oxoglutarate dehydrogenase complex dihydrolipoamide dehydrogenase (E3) component